MFRRFQSRSLFYYIIFKSLGLKQFLLQRFIILFYHQLRFQNQVQLNQNYRYIDSMRKVYGRGLNIAGQIDNTHKNYKKFTQIQSLNDYTIRSLGCGYLQSYYLLSDGQLIKSGHHLDTLTSIRMIRLYKNFPRFYNYLRNFKSLGSKIGLPFLSHDLTLLNKNQVLSNTIFKRALFNQAGIHAFDQNNNMYVVGENYFGQRATSDSLTFQSIRKIEYLNVSIQQAKVSGQIVDTLKSKNINQKLIRKKKIKDVALGFQHTIIITQDGQAFGCGKADASQIQPYKYHHYKDFVVLDKIQIPELVYGKKVVTKAACGYKHSILLTQDQKLYSIGLNMYGQCGHHYVNQPQVKKITEVYLPLLDNQKILDIQCGSNHSMILTNMNVYFMGHVQKNQNPFSLFKQNVASPSIMNLPSKPVKIFANFDRSAIITQDNKLYLFGGVDLSLKGGQSGKLEVVQDYSFNKDSLVGLGLSHTIIYP